MDIGERTGRLIGLYGSPKWNRASTMAKTPFKKSTVSNVLLAFACLLAPNELSKGAGIKTAGTVCEHRLGSESEHTLRFTHWQRDFPARTQRIGKITFPCLPIAKPAQQSPHETCAWSHRAGRDDSDERFVAVLEIPAVTSPETAVKVAIAAEVKSRK